MPRNRKFIVYVATSADGFIARADGSVDWLDRPSPKGNYGMNTFYRSIDGAVLGRKTYDFAASHGMSIPCPGKKNYVLSRTLEKAANPEVTVVSDSVANFADRLRNEKGRNVWLMGGAESVAAFLDCGQVDEFIIHVIPKMIGEGIPLVAPRHRDLSLKLLASKEVSRRSREAALRGKERVRTDAACPERSRRVRPASEASVILGILKIVAGAGEEDSSAAPSE
jgi:dihydrofolate reductase